MSESISFLPPRRKGLILHIAAAILLAAASGLSFFFALEQEVGGVFGLLLLLGTLLVAPLILAGYRGYALLGGGYALERDGLRLRWGLRAEDIPLPDVEWVRRAADLAYHLPLPPLSVPGAVLGTIHSPELGPVEFLASDINSLVLVATPQKVYAISPADPEEFLRAFQSGLEMGSLAPFAPFSARPAAYLAGAWKDRWMRWLVLGGLGLTAALFIVVALLIPASPPLPLGFLPSGVPQEAGPAVRLLLLPVLSALAFVVDLVAGLFFYRRPARRPVAYLVWAAGVLAPILLLVAVGFILGAA